MPSTWVVAEPTLPALTFTYSFGPGTANALAFPVEGGVAVVSAPFQPAEAVFTELEQHGKVRAILAPNAFHSMGLPGWKARYPDAPIFAPAQSIARLEKGTKLRGIRPVAEGAKLFGDRVEIVDMPHYRTGEVLVRWRIGHDGGHPHTPGHDGWAWYVTDVMMNLPEVPKGLFGLVFGWTRSCPGLRRNAIAGLMMIKDKRALYRWMNEQAEKAPPRRLIPCHGAARDLADPPVESRAALA
jgi:hypothetical protein